MDPPLCANGCGFFGSHENQNMCSKCYKDHILKLNQRITESMRNTTMSFAAAAADDQDLKTGKHKNESMMIRTTCGVSACESGALKCQKKKRCKSCNKKIGLTGFVCQCGELFCGKHRYPEEHSCAVDYKQIGRQLLTKQNPLCKADKLGQI